MVNMVNIRADPDFNEIAKRLAVKHNITVKTVTTVLAGRLKGRELVEVRDKNGRAKTLTFKKLKQMDVTELFDDINI